MTAHTDGTPAVSTRYATPSTSTQRWFGPGQANTPVTPPSPPDSNIPTHVPASA